MGNEIVGHDEIGYVTTDVSDTDSLTDLVFGRYFLQFAFWAEAKRRYGENMEKAAYIANMKKNGN